MYKKITVCLDLTARDKTLIGYVAWLSAHLQPESVTLLHATHISYLPENLRAKYLTDVTLARLKKRIRSELKSASSKVVGFQPCIRVLDGDPRRNILEWIEENETDLIVIGKGHETHAGGFAEKIARRSHCSILVVPQGSKPSLRRILCPTDFSENSILAARTAYELGGLVNAKSMQLFHLYYPPVHQYSFDQSSQYYTDFDTNDMFDGEYEDFDQELKEDAQMRLEEIRGRLPEGEDGLFVTTVVESGHYPSAAIVDDIIEYMAELCVVGHQGHSRLESFFLGSITEKLIQRTPVPLLINRSGSVEIQ